MDWGKQVQVIHGSYCSVDLLRGMYVKDNSIEFGIWVGVFFYISFVCFLIFLW